MSFHVRQSGYCVGSVFLGTPFFGDSDSCRVSCVAAEKRGKAKHSGWCDQGVVKRTQMGRGWETPYQQSTFQHVQDHVFSPHHRKSRKEISIRW